MGEPPLDWSLWALILIDVQADFWTPAHRDAFPDFPRRVEELLAHCRGSDLDVVHVRSRFRADGSDWMPAYRLRESIPCIEGTGGDAVLPFAAEEPGEAVFLKRTLNAFEAHGLSEHLREQGKKLLLVAGLETSYCVFLTAAAAGQRGFLSLLIEDCCADSPGYDPNRTAEFLARYEGIVLWRLGLAELVGSHGKWMERLGKIGGRKLPPDP